MIDVQIKEDENVFVIKPDSEISARDIAVCTIIFDEYINVHDRVPNLIIRAHAFPHWKNFDALKHHFKFVHDHHELAGC